MSEGVERRGNLVALDPGDGGLQGAGSLGELLLRQSMAQAPYRGP